MTVWRDEYRCTGGQAQSEEGSATVKAVLSETVAKNQHHRR